MAELLQPEIGIFLTVFQLHSACIMPFLDSSPSCIVQGETPVSPTQLNLRSDRRARKTLAPCFSFAWIFRLGNKFCLQKPFSVDLKGLLLPAMFYLRAVWYALINSRGHVFLMSSSFYQEQLHFLPSEDMEIKASREGCQLASQSPQPGW